jgi:hypothetical protein
LSFQEQLVMAGSPQPRPQVIQPDDPSIRLIPLTRGQVAMVDADRYEWAMRWNCYAAYNRCTGTYYAARQGRHGEPKTVWLHRQIAGEPNSDVDHVNHDTLDNRPPKKPPLSDHGAAYQMSLFS